MIDLNRIKGYLPYGYAKLLAERLNLSPSYIYKVVLGYTVVENVTLINQIFQLVLEYKEYKENLVTTINTLLQELGIDKRVSESFTIEKQTMVTIRKYLPRGYAKLVIDSIAKNKTYTMFPLSNTTSSIYKVVHGVAVNPIVLLELLKLAKEHKNQREKLTHDMTTFFTNLQN